MQEAIAQILSYVWGVWRFRWLALVVAWVIALGGWLFVQQMPEAYVSTARIYVDSNNVLRPLLRGLAIQPNVDQRIAMMSRTLLSRPNLEKVMRMTDLDLEVQTDREKEEFLTELRGAISLYGDRGNSSLYSIEVLDADRDIAKRITQALITVFIESGLSDKREVNTGAQDFLDQQIADYEQRLVEAESRLAAFKQRHVGVLPGEGGGFYARLDQAARELSAAKLQLREMENRRRELQRQIDGEEPVFLSSGISASDSPLDARIQALNAKMDALLAKYTERHPEVRQIRGLIQELEAEKRAELESARANDYTGAYAGLSSSPVYQGMRAMLGETDAQVAELRVRVAEYEARVQALNDKVNSIPEIEAQLKQLDRDYQVIASQHQELLQRREAAKLSEDVQQNASDVTFRVIDPPFVPSRPSEPNKLLLNTLVLVVALGAGAALALLASLIRPVVVDQQSLTKLTGLPLLGTVTLIPTPEQSKRDAWGLVVFSSLVAVLMVAFVGLNIGQVLMLS
ncbi:MAG: chain length-determining protein [Halioglobus sp.]|nr:chain length-determining protein [Halioglobus sp.]